MAHANVAEPRENFIDPRIQPGFAPEHWPLCNGEPAPEAGAAADDHECRCLEFLAAYYEVNRCHAKVQAAREAGAPERKIADHLEEVAGALSAVDALEDRHVTIGFFGEPVMEDMFYRDIHFVRPGLSSASPVLTPVSSHIAIPGLEEIPASEFEGTARVFRFEHGKVDL